MNSYQARKGSSRSGSGEPEPTQRQNGCLDKQQKGLLINRSWQCILHDWKDEDCVKILKKCKESIPSREEGGKVIIIDMVMEDPKQSDEFVRAQNFMDLLMMVIYAAKERTKKDWEKIFIEAGFNDYKITPTLGLRSLIELSLNNKLRV